MAVQEKRFLQETLNKIMKDVNHDIPLMKLIEDIPVEDEETREKTNKLLEKLDNLQKQHDQMIGSY